MNCFKKLTVCLLAVAFAAVCTHAAPAQKAHKKSNQEIADSIRTELEVITSPADSIRLLYDLFDLAGYAERFEVGDQLYFTAKRANNIPVQLDMACRLADIAMTMFNPELTESMLERLETIPESQERDIAECFIKACIAPSRKFSNEKELSDEIQRLLNELSEDKENHTLDKYERIARMFTLAEYLQGFTQGTFLTEYLDRLDTEINQIPFDKGSLMRNKFYATAAMMYLRNEQFDKAAKADRRLLAAMDRIEEKNGADHRKYRDLAINRYVSYRRILKCYSAISEEAVRTVYDKIMELAARNQDIADDMEVLPIPQMALKMKTGDYAGALPLLKILVANSGSLYEKKYYLRQLKLAAEETGNREELAAAAIDYANILEEYTDLKTAERLRELEVNYNYQAQLDSNAEEIKNHEHTVMILAIISFVLLIIVIIAFVVMTVRLSTGKRKLAKANAQLVSEGEELRATTESLRAARDKARKADTEKTQLVNYVTNEVLNPITPIVEYSQMIVDNAQGENKEYLERFKSIVDVNIRLLQGLVADVQELAVVESGELPVNRTPVNLNEIGQTVVESIQPLVNPGVEIEFIPANEGKRLIFNTDSRRVEIVLLNLLSNAAKFTAKGSIKLALNIDDKTGDAAFSVTDTGTGIPADKAEIIFERFEKLDPSVEGSGLGLSVCAMVARALDATVSLDTTYSGPGARFVFTLHHH